MRAPYDSPEASKAALVSIPSYRRTEVDSFKEPVGVIRGMRVERGEFRRTRVLVWPALPAVIAVCLLAAPSMAGSPAAYHKTFLPPYLLNGEDREYGGSGCGVVCQLSFNLTSGVLAANDSEEVTRCQPHALRCLWSYAFSAAGGVTHLGFKVPIAGYYNVSAAWSGTIFANLSVFLNNSALGTVQANYTFFVVSYMCCGPNHAKSVSQAYQLANGSIQSGTKSYRIVAKATSPLRMWLTPRKLKYHLTEYIEVIGSGFVSKSAKPGASTEVLFDSPGGVALKYVSVT